MKGSRDRALEHVLNFVEEDLSQHKSKAAKIKRWDELKKFLFWDDPKIILPKLQDLEGIQKVLREFLDYNLIRILNAYQSYQWQGSPGDDLHSLIQKELAKGRIKKYKTAFNKVIKDNPSLANIWAFDNWRSEKLPWPESERSFMVVGGQLTYDEHYFGTVPFAEIARQQLIKLMAMEPISLSDFFRCENATCNRWVFSGRKRKHKVCSKKCYDQKSQREKRSTPEGKEANRNASRSYYRNKILGV